MRSSEVVALAYFAYLAGAAWRAEIAPARRWQVTAIAAAIIGLVLVLALVLGDARVGFFRDWLPITYILVGYWLPVLLTRAPNAKLERWLLDLDDRLLWRAGVWPWIERAPRAWLEYFELSYLLCYPLVPAAFAALYFGGRFEQADRFWTAVMLAVYSCYGLLPWLPTRAPRAVEGPGAVDRRRPAIRALNLRVLQHGSVTWNTFPSGHAAGGVSAALSVMVDMPIVGAALLLLAISIMIGSVLGRYHYAADAMAGAAVAIAATLVAAFIA
jgi:hypothetical protein